MSNNDELNQKILDALNQIQRNTGGGSRNGYRNTNNQGAAAAAAALAANQSKASKATEAAAKTLTDFGTASSNAVAALTKYTSSVNSAIDGFASLSKVLVGGVLANQLASTLKTTIKTYQDMTNVGQSFGGSMLKMQMAAANAALPLDEFARVVKQNSLVVAATGTKSFLDLNKTLRGNLMAQGMLGMSTTQLNDFMTDYLETQRLYGNINNLNSERAAKSLSNLAVETTKVANLTGKNRDEITKTAQAALRDESLRARVLQMSSTSVDGFNDAMQKSMVYMAGLPGEAGKTLSRMLAQTAGRGSSLLSDDMQTFIDAGMFGVTGMMDSIKAKIDAGTVTDQDMAQFNKDFVAEGMRNMAALQFQASTGNQAAKRAIDMISEMKSIADKSPEELGRQQRFTNFLNTLEETLNRLSGSLKSKLLSGLGVFMDNIEKFINSPAFDQLQTRFGELAERFGKFLSDTLTPDKLERIGNGLVDFMEKLADGAVKVTRFMEPLFSAFSKLTDHMGLLGAVLTTVVGYKLAKAGVKYAGKKALTAGKGFVGRAAGALKEKYKIGGVAGDLIDGALGTGGPATLDDLSVSAAGGKALRVVVVGGGMGGSGGGWSDSGGIPEKGGSGGKKPSKWGKLGKLAGHLKGGLIGMAASTALDYLTPDFKGKEAISGISSYAGLGATAGSFLGPLGTLAGGALGGAYGLYQNWGDAKAGLSAGYDALFGSKSGSTLPETSAVPAIPSDQIQSQFAELQKQQTKTLAENAELRQQMNKVFDMIAQNGMNQSSGTREMIEEMKKSNRSLDTVSGSIL